MRKNERLVGIRPYQTSTGDWHLELTYAYEDKKGEHRVIFPDVLCPFPTQAIPFPAQAIPFTAQAILFPDTAHPTVGTYLRSCGFSIPGLEQIPLNMGSCQLAQERGNRRPFADEKIVSETSGTHNESTTNNFYIIFRSRR